MQTEVLTSIIAAATALVAVLASPFLAARTSKNQMIGPMRQAWIYDLRDNLSTYCAHLSINRWHHLPSPDEADSEQERKQFNDFSRIQEAIRLREKLFLLLNPQEAQHIALASLIQSAFDTYEQVGDTSKVLVALRVNAQVVLKTEWDVVKR